MAVEHDLVVLANRLPVRRVEGKWAVSPGGLVSALLPLLEGRSCAWAGWSGVAGRAPGPFRFGGIAIRPIPVSREEVERFYYGFSNATLWPLYHDAIRQPEYHRQWWGPYEAVNRRFAEVAAELLGRGGTVWIHDYHLQLVPSFLRELRPDVPIGFFLHVPFPPRELFARLPWRRQILEGLLAADLVGFQTRDGAENFADLAVRYAEARRNEPGLRWRGRDVRLGTFPVSVDTGRFEELAARPATVERMEHLRATLGAGRKILLGVDRLDYTKGIDIRLRAFGDLLAAGDVTVDDCCLIQTAVPSRERVAKYRRLKRRVEALVGQINGEHGAVGRPAVHYLHRGLDVEELAALYRAADVMVVTPLRDGMNLVAKEYVATRVDEDGVLVLSEFTGAAEELRSALMVNPYDIDAFAGALRRAISMSRTERSERMKELRSVVRGYTVYDWGRNFLRELEG